MRDWDLDDMARWKRDAEDFGWIMPAAPCWKRVPVIRHIRAIWGGWQVARHEAFYRALGGIPTGYDRWVLFGIWHGKELSQ